MFRRAGCYFWTRSCALALAFLLGSVCAQSLVAQNMLVNGGAVPAPYGPMTQVATLYDNPYGQPTVQAAPPSNAWIAPPDAGQPTYGQPQYGQAPYGQAPYAANPEWGAPVVAASPSDFWCWQLMPKNVIYHSYQAGVHEPRLGITVESERESHQSYWDGTLGGRVGLLRYGNNDMFMPQGWELDVEAAAMVRLTFDEVRDFETADYRVGIPLTYGIENWQFKFAVYHLSSHMGDEFAIAHPGALADRINYVRDSLAAGVSYYPVPFMRLYAEAGWCFHFDGGAEPWEFQLGTELSKPGPTGFQGTPFLAVNGHLRQDVDFGGDINTEAGWLWRNDTNQTMRAGVQYFYGHSSQYQTFSRIEQQIGFGLWYDF